MSWRVGRKVGRTIYNEHGDLVGMMDTPALAARVVEALNGFDQHRAESEKRGRELAAIWRALEPSDTNKIAIAAKVTWRGSPTDFITDLLCVLIDTATWEAS